MEDRGKDDVGQAAALVERLRLDPVTSESPLGGVDLTILHVICLGKRLPTRQNDDVARLADTCW